MIETAEVSFTSFNESAALKREECGLGQGCHANLQPASQVPAIHARSAPGRLREPSAARARLSLGACLHAHLAGRAAGRVNSRVLAPRSQIVIAALGEVEDNRAVVAQIGIIRLRVGGRRTKALAAMAGAMVQRPDLSGGVQALVQASDPDQIEQRGLLPGIAPSPVPVGRTWFACREAPQAQRRQDRLQTG